MLTLNFERNLRAKVTVGILVPLFLILGSFTLAEHIRHTNVVQENLSALALYSGRIVESNLRHAMNDDDLTEVQVLLDTISEEELQVVYVLNPSGEVIFAPDGIQLGVILDSEDADCQLCHRLPPEQRPSNVVLRNQNGQRVFRSMYPLENRQECTECHESDGRLLGLLLTDITMTPMESSLKADLRENLLWWAGAILVTVMVVNYAISRLVLRRLQALAGAMAGLGQGHLSPPLPEDQPDEIGQLASAFNLMAHQIENRSKENEALSEDLRRESLLRGELLQRVITAQEDERARVARELHDELGQSLSGLALGAEVTQQLITSDPDRARAHLGQVQNLIAETTGQMYDLILDLRPSALDDLGLVAALRGYAERTLSGSEIQLELAAGELKDRLPPAVETTLYRIFQEALNNVVRHASATQVRIELRQQNGSFDGSITDDGIGFDPQEIQMDGGSPRGLGLAGMRERAAGCSGQVLIISEPGKGTSLKISIPIERQMYCE